MNAIRYRWVLYIITSVILGTIAIQVYWNYKNYQVSKQQYINDVQVSLDNAVDTYYANLAKQNSLAIALDINSKQSGFKLDSILYSLDKMARSIKIEDSLQINIIEDVSGFIRFTSDSSEINIQRNSKSKDWHSKQIYVDTNQHQLMDSLSEEDFKTLTSKVMISMTSDTLKIEDIDHLLTSELHRKDLNIDYKLVFTSLFNKSQNSSISSVNKTTLSTTSKSTYLPQNSTLTLNFTNATRIILKRILSGILLSTLLVLALISCLFYLLYIIKHQKQLAEVKNDLISNITHEFKTPIATISVALESIKNFNIIDDKEKTKTYLDMSENQLKKLNTMVEKLLETASLDSENLDLNKEEINLVELLQIMVDKHQMQTEFKTLHFNPSNKTILAHVDVFHFENAINNVIDNAIKYGGDSISINLSQQTVAFTLSISDNGTTLNKTNKEKIFEKFYRIPKGNTHDIKGFGIGLYYTKKIIEKHGGIIDLDLNNNGTTFKISIPNA